MGILSPKYVLIINMIIFALVLVWFWFIKTVNQIYIAAFVLGTQVGKLAEWLATVTSLEIYKFGHFLVQIKVTLTELGFCVANESSLNSNTLDGFPYFSRSVSEKYIPSIVAVVLLLFGTHQARWVRFPGALCRLSSPLLVSPGFSPSTSSVKKLPAG